MVVARSIIKDHNAVFLISHNCIIKLMYFKLCWQTYIMSTQCITVVYLPWFKRGGYIYNKETVNHHCKHWDLYFNMYNLCFNCDYQLQDSFQLCLQKLKVTVSKTKHFIYANILVLFGEFAMVGGQFISQAPAVLTT